METEIFEKYGLKPQELLLETEQLAMWKMTQPAINRTVLVHVLGPSLVADPEGVAYLFSVVRAISNTSSGALSQIYTIFDEADFKAIVTEHVDGLSLDKAVSALGPLSIKQTVRTGIALAEGLCAIWNASHIIYGSVRPEFVVLDAGSTAKLISPCFAHVAPADLQVPDSDISDLGELLYFLATGVTAGAANTVNLPVEFTNCLERMSSDNPMKRFASWESLIKALKGLENLSDKSTQPAVAPGAAVPAAGGKRRIVKHTLSAPKNAVPKAVKSEGPHHAAALASRFSEPGAVAVKAGSAASAGAKKPVSTLPEEAKSPISGFHLLLWAVLAVALATTFVLRIGALELQDRTAQAQAAALAAQHEEKKTIAVEDDAPAEESATTAASTSEPAEQEAVVEVPQVSVQSAEDAALNRYFAANLSKQVPFLYRGQEHPVALVSYTETTVTIRRGSKQLTLQRADLSPDQIDLWSVPAN